MTLFGRVSGIPERLGWLRLYCRNDRDVCQPGLYIDLTCPGGAGWWLLAAPERLPSVSQARGVFGPDQVIDLEQAC